MIFIKSTLLALVASTAFASESSLRVRNLTDGFDTEGCPSEDKAKCFLVNLETNHEIALGSGTVWYDPKDSSMGCDGLPKRDADNAPDIKGLNFVKWNIPGKEAQTQFDPAWWINGDNSGVRPNAEPYLDAKCEDKENNVSFHTWRGDREFTCFIKDFHLKAECDEPACPVGKKLVNGYCVCTWCNDDFHCPAKSSRKPNRECYNNFDDCECEGGLIKEHGQCVEKPVCPAGKKLVNGYCVCTWCNDDFHCPANSSRKPHRECYNNFDDCECKDGLIKEHGRCVEKPVCPAGKKFVNGYCVCTWCNDDFHCPAKSSRKPNRECYNNFDDCECEGGLVKEHGRCVEKKEYTCPANSHKQSSVSWCKGLRDCKCNYGYYRKNNQCARSSWCWW